MQRGNLKGWRVKSTKLKFKVSFNYTFVNEVAINTNMNPLKFPNETLLHYNCYCFFKIVKAFILNTLYLYQSLMVLLKKLDLLVVYIKSFKVYSKKLRQTNDSSQHNSVP